MRPAYRSPLSRTWTRRQFQLRAIIRIVSRYLGLGEQGSRSLLAVRITKHNILRTITEHVISQVLCTLFAGFVPGPGYSLTNLLMLSQLIQIVTVSESATKCKNEARSGRGIASCCCSYSFQVCRILVNCSYGWAEGRSPSSRQD